MPGRKRNREKAEMLHVNGIDATTGEYLLKPVSAANFAKAVAGLPSDEESEAAARKRIEDLEDGLMKVIEGVDDTKVEEAGWGIVFSGRPEHAEAVKVIRRQLEPLIKHRQA